MLSAALDLFSQKGFKNVSVHEIAEHAEFAIGTLYKFFKNKEDIYNTLLLEAADRFHVALTSILEEKEDCHPKLQKYIHTYGDLFMTSSRAVRLYFAETFGGSFNLRATLTKELRAYYDAGEAMLGRVFAEGIQKGVYRPMDPDYLAMALHNMIITFLFKWLDDPEKHPFAASIPIIETIFFQGVMVKNKGDDSD
jgi:AcrR family transcriptional regulator